MLMNSSTNALDAEDPRKRLFSALHATARQRFSSDAQWARASGVPKETLSRFRTRLTCDTATLWALANGAGCTLVAVPRLALTAEKALQSFDRNQESILLDLCSSGNQDNAYWRAHGDTFLLGGLATLLASASGFDRARYLRLAESLHIGITTPEVFASWLKLSPIRPARFLPMLRARMNHATR
jgi:ABC-type Fe3+ transport system permease subunit